MPPIPKNPTADDIATDAGHTAAFLRAIDAVMPGYINEELLGLLDSVRNNRMILELLTKALSAGR